VLLASVPGRIKGKWTWWLLTVLVAVYFNPNNREEGQLSPDQAHTHRQEGKQRSRPKTTQIKGTLGEKGRKTFQSWPRNQDLDKRPFLEKKVAGGESGNGCNRYCSAARSFAPAGEGISEGGNENRKGVFTLISRARQRAVRGTGTV